MWWGLSTLVSSLVSVVSVTCTARRPSGALEVRRREKLPNVRAGGEDTAAGLATHFSPQALDWALDWKLPKGLQEPPPPPKRGEQGLSPVRLPRSARGLACQRRSSSLPRFASERGCRLRPEKLPRPKQ